MINILKHTGKSLASIAEQLNGIRNGDGFSCHCPSHKDGRRSLSLKLSDDGKLLAYCHAGCDFKNIINEINNITGGVREFKQPEKQTQQRQPKLEYVRDKIWQETVPVKPGDPVHRYLTQTRRLPLTTIPTDLRYHSNLGYFEYDGTKSVKVNEFPAMVAAIRDVKGVLLTLHRTYLTPDGRKLSAQCPDLTTRKIMPGGGGNGGAIRLGDAGEELVVAEGIETALAASILSGLPAWSTVTAGGLAKVEVPKGVKEVSICVDNDEAGIRAALTLSGSLLSTGKKVFLAHASDFSTSKNADWADLMIEEAA